MTHTTEQQKKRRGRSVSFNPNREFISDAVEQFLRQGGEITRLQANKIDIREKLEEPAWIDLEDNAEADEFLYD
jgi:hypothetical protein